MNNVRKVCLQQRLPKVTRNYSWNLTLLKSPGNLHLTLQLHYTFHSTIENFSACCNPWKPTVFPRLARWQLKVFEREKSARNRKKVEKTETGKASIALIHSKTEIDRNYFCFNLPLHLKTYPCWQALPYVYSLFFLVVRTNWQCFRKKKNIQRLNTFKHQREKNCNSPIDGSKLKRYCGTACRL